MAEDRRDPGRTSSSRRAFLATALVGGLGLAGAAVATGVVRSRYAPPLALPQGSLRFADSVVGSWEFGTHRLVIEDGAVSVEDAQGKALWASSPSQTAFVAAARSRIRWRENTAHFSSSRVLDRTWADQSVERIDKDSGAREENGSSGDTGRVVITGQLTSRIAAPQEYTLSLDSVDAHRVDAALSVPGSDLVVLRFTRGPEEGVHGLGAQFTDFDLSGRYIEVITREQGVGRGREPLTTLAELVEGGGGAPETTYAAIPFAATDAMRAISVDTHHPCAFDLRGREDIAVEVYQPSVRMRLYSASDPFGLVSAYTADTGRQEDELPLWSGEGAILGVQGGPDEVRQAVGALEEEGAALAAVWLQDWTGQRRTSFGERLWWNWVLDRDRYPDWEELVEELGERGIRVLTYVNPFLVDPADKPGGVDRDLFAEARAAGYLVLNSEGSPYLLDQGGYDAALVDLTNPRAYSWFRDVVVEEVAGAGADGWMADFAEGLPMDAVLYEGDPAEWHNRWPVEWARLNDEARTRAGRPDALVFHRSAGMGSAEHAVLFWAGDQTVTFDAYDGLASAVRGMLAGGVSGLALNHSDAGGYTGLDQPLVGISRDRELLLRWVEMSVWGPILRTHEGNLPQSNVQAYDTECRAAFAEQSRMFAALSDYRREVVTHASRTGIPVLRHVWLHAPDSRAAGSDEVFMFGSVFFVAPVLEAGADQVTATLPPGEWVHLWSARLYAGDTESTIPAPLGRPAVFYRRGDETGERVRERLAELAE